MEEKEDDSIKTIFGQDLVVPPTQQELIHVIRNTGTYCIEVPAGKIMKHFWHLEFPIISRAIKKSVCNLCAVNIIAKILL